MSSQDLASKLIQETANRFLSGEIPAVCKVDINVANTAIRIHLSSKALKDLIDPAFAWQVDDSTLEPEVEIFVLEGTHALVSPWRLDDFQDGGRIRGLDTGQVEGAFDLGNTVLNLFDKSTNRGLFWTRAASALPEWEFGAPLRHILTWALREKGIYVLHSASIGLGKSGLLICGAGGAGKSTTTAIAAQNGFLTTGDDYCAISWSGTPKVFGIYGFLKLVPGAVGTSHLSKPAGLTARVDGKAHYSLASSMTKSLSIGSILFTKVGDVTKSLSRKSQTDALLSLVGSTLPQSIIPQREMFEVLGRLAKTVPAFEMQVGPDLIEYLGGLGELCRN